MPARSILDGARTLVARSEAKQLLAGCDRFLEVVLDFADVDWIGPSFADEVFRVFANDHPATSVTWTGANEAVQRMIARAQLARDQEPDS